MAEDNWVAKNSLTDEGDGFVGFVHNAVIEHQLKNHDAPEDIEFYFCGPPMMNQAVLKMVDDCFNKEEQEKIKNAIHSLASKGYRLLGVGETRFEGGQFPEKQTSTHIHISRSRQINLDF